MSIVPRAVLLTILNLLLASHATACRVPPRPTALAAVEADAIVLVRITHSEATGDWTSPWTASAALRAKLWGEVAEKDFTFRAAFPGSCRSTGMPRPERYWIAYLRKTAEGLQVQEAYPFWWARQSGDERLRRLDAAMPLGAARPPTAEEEWIIGLAEPRVKLPPGVKNLKGYTRIYAHSSSSTFRVTMFPSLHPRRLIVDSFEEWPTRQSCRCEPIEQMIDIQDLRDSGRIPPFDP